jgi:hypothetical protein
LKKRTKKLWPGGLGGGGNAEPRRKSFLFLFFKKEKLPSTFFFRAPARTLASFAAKRWTFR